MPRTRDPFRLALEDIRSRAMQGLYPPGGSVVIIEEARRLGLSTTPVREALAYLCGEGLMERAPRAGYLAPRLDASLLSDRFCVRLRCLVMSLDLAGALAPAPTQGAPADALVRDLFDRLVRVTGNRALFEIFRRIDNQLHLLGKAEERVFQDTAEEAGQLAHIDAVGSRTQLVTAIEAYHRRRMENAALIVLEVERSVRLSVEGG